MARQRANRIRRRVTCELQLGGRSYRGIVLDLSESGVFVQTEASPPAGTPVRVRFHALGGIEFEVEMTVARRQVAPPQLASVVRGGLGLKVENPPATYYKLIGMESASTPGGARGVGREPVSRGAKGPAEEAAPAAPPPEAPSAEFRVRVKQSDGPRSRTLKVKAGSLAEARKAALVELGRGWEILSVEAA
jgi:PilZ domain-containing protein